MALYESSSTKKVRSVDGSLLAEITADEHGISWRKEQQLPWSVEDADAFAKALAATVVSAKRDHKKVNHLDDLVLELLPKVVGEAWTLQRLMSEIKNAGTATSRQTLSKVLQRLFEEKKIKRKADLSKAGRPLHYWKANGDNVAKGNSGAGQNTASGRG